jgi:phage shock protein E
MRPSMNQLVYIIPLLLIVVFFLAKQRGVATTEQVKSAMQKGAKVIDVRSPQEYASGHLPTAVNIPVDELETRIGKYATNKEQPLLLHCASGMRSGRGKTMLQKLGYTQVLNIGSYGRAANMLKDF